MTQEFRLVRVRSLGLHVGAGVLCGILAQIADGFAPWSSAITSHGGVWLLLIIIVALGAASERAAAVRTVALFGGVLAGYYAASTVDYGYAPHVQLVLFWALLGATAVVAGYDVTIFCAGDAAYLMKDAVVEHTKGIGTGALSDSLPAVVAAGVPIYVSGGSSKTRGVNDEDLANKNATFATPAQLVEMTFAADRVLCY